MFTAPAPPEPVVDEELFTENEIVIRWSSVTGADFYRTSLTLRNGSEVSPNIGGLGSSAATNVTITNLRPDVLYTLLVVSVNSGGTGSATLNINGCE